METLQTRGCPAPAHTWVDRTEPAPIGKVWVGGRATTSYGFCSGWYTPEERDEYLRRFYDSMSGYGGEVTY